MRSTPICTGKEQASAELFYSAVTTRLPKIHRLRTKDALGSNFLNPKTALKIVLRQGFNSPRLQLLDFERLIPRVVCLTTKNDNTLITSLSVSHQVSAGRRPAPPPLFWSSGAQTMVVWL